MVSTSAGVTPAMQLVLYVCHSHQPHGQDHARHTVRMVRIMPGNNKPDTTSRRETASLHA